ncbi:MAG: DUF3320 domain-containing protein [Planctomycetota bacterium]
MRPGLRIDVRHSASLCYALQQSAWRWLQGIRLQNDGERIPAGAELVVQLAPVLTTPWRLPLAELPAGAVFDVPVPDLPLRAEVFANLVEGARAELVVALERDGATLAEHRSPIDLLAYNEWPGLRPLPGLLAAFVAANHPSLTPLLQAAAAALQRATGDPALDGYQRRSPARVQALVEAVHDAVTGVGITYVGAPPSYERQGQKVRTPEQVVGERLGTCLDLAVLYAAVFEHVGLEPLVVLVRGHAFVGVWLQPTSSPHVELGPAVELRKRVDAGALLVLEATAACSGQRADLAAACQLAQKRLGDEGFDLAVDVAAARRTGIRPLPLRTHVFQVVEPLGDDPAVASRQVRTGVPEVGEPAAAAGAGAGAPASPTPSPPPPKDRLEHWKGKLLDLSMWNRLLNFSATKKTLPLLGKDLAALEDRLQQGGRVRVFARPDLGQHGDSPRDLELAAQQSGVDVLARYLGEELRAGRLRADLDDEELQARQVEIYRHARTSLEESGANTLYLAIGFLKYYETRESQKPRRAPLLLLPLVVERSSVADGCRFVLDDAEPRLNQTLRQFLLRDFELQVPLGDTPPEGEVGVDVDAVLAAFRDVALRMPRWEVEATACIGFFSFTKYLMFLDLADREALLQSPVLQHLVERPGATFAQDAPEFARERLDEHDAVATFCPKDADSSQLAAVLAAANGRSFVLEGPPGTGKSQTITNLIAQALATGQRVLFVAEKRAALEVVQRRLAEVGLGPFCLELHSSKSGPKAVLEQLRQALEVGQRREPAEWAQLASELQATRTQLNAVVHDLHRPREHGSSVFAAMGECIARRSAVRVAWPGIGEAAPERVRAALAAIAELAGVAAALGVPRQSPWWGVHRADWTPALERQVPAATSRAVAAIDALARAFRGVAEVLALDTVLPASGPGRAQLALVLRLAQLWNAPSLPPSSLVRSADWRSLDGELSRASQDGAQRDAAWAPLAGRWRRELLQQDLDRLVPAVARAVGSFVLLRWWRLRGPRAELAGMALGALPAPARLLEDLQAASAVRTRERDLLQRSAVATVLGAAWRASLCDWSQLNAWLDWVREVRRLLVQLQPGALAPAPAVLDAFAQHLDALADGSDQLPSRLGALRAAHDEWLAAKAGLDELLRLHDDEAFGPAEAPGCFATIADRLAGYGPALPSLRDFCAYRQVADAATSHGAEPWVQAHADGRVPVAQLVDGARVTFLEAWLDVVHAHEPALARFRGQDHERTIARFTALDQQALRLCAEVVRARLSARVPQLRDTQVASSELGVLERELKKQRKHKPVRKLLAEIPGLLGRLAPCVLMSPLSVAQYLARSSARFDLVVFDEASQIPMWDAVGAIGRGDSLVVVGDSRQLPPTTFFQRQAQDVELGLDELPEDLESLLDECSVAGLPKLHLDWHYRSRHESLIAFSNHHYYQNRLLTFPSPEAGAAGLGVRCVRVNGVYERAGSQQNPIEAEALCNEVLARLLDPVRCQQSLGVVTFSQAQQVLIENRLDQARRERPEVEAAWHAASEPVFVKNLENVQGDERDVILFSICYGPDAQGRLFENYGPLNTQGGERRLNVAVTRARRELVVFTSVGPEQIANRTQALGARHLRAFLDYALRGTAALQATTTLDPGRGVDSPFEAAVCEGLRARGHEVHTQVGCSGYRIDLAVVDPAASGRYLLGIECDGASYHSAATARDRDRLRASVLRGLGWRLARVWSTDFWHDPDGELDRLEAAIEAARVAAVAGTSAPRFESAASSASVEAGVAPLTTAGTSATTGGPPAADGALAPAPTAPSSAGESPVSPGVAAPREPAATVEASTDPDGPRPYVAATVPSAGTAEQFASAPALAVLRQQVAAVLAVEAPLAFDRLCRTIAVGWQVTRVTERVRERIRAAIPPGVLVDGAWLWRDGVQRDAFRGFRVPGDDETTARDLDEVPPAELAAAMRWLLVQHQALSRDDLARETARCFGIARLGAVVKDVMAGALAQELAAGRLVADGDVVRLG